MLSSWVVGQQIRNFYHTAGRFTSTFGQTYYLFIPGVAGGSEKKGQGGRVEVTDVMPSIWYPGQPDRKGSDPSFKYDVTCRLLTMQDLVPLQMVSYENGVFPVTISYLARGKVIPTVVLGEAKLQIDVVNPSSQGGLWSTTLPLYRLTFEARRMRVTAP